MVYTKDEILELLKEFKKAIEGIIRPDRIILFGSYASGRAEEFSDIDVAVVSSDIKDENYHELRLKVFKKAMELSLQLEPLCFSKEEFENDWLPIVPEIKQNGIEI